MNTENMGEDYEEKKRMFYLIKEQWARVDWRAISREQMVQFEKGFWRLSKTELKDILILSGYYEK